MSKNFGVREALAGLKKAKRSVREDGYVDGVGDEPVVYVDDVTPVDPVDEDPLVTAFKLELASFQPDVVIVSEQEDGTVVDASFADGTTASFMFVQTEEGPVVRVVIGEEAYEIAGGEGDYSQGVVVEDIPFDEIRGLLEKSINSQVPSEVLRAVYKNGKIEQVKVARPKNLLTPEKRAALAGARRVFKGAKKEGSAHRIKKITRKG